MGQKHFLEKLDWSLLETFRVIVEEGGVTRAAARLFLTQSAVSHGLKRIESQMGVSLVDRSQRSFLLTEHGMALFRAATRIHQELAALDSNWGERHIVYGSIKLLVVSRIISETYDSFLVSFRRRNPQISIDAEVLPCADILQQLEKQVAAVGLAICRHDHKNLERVLLIHERYSLYCGKHHPLFSQKYISKEQIQSQRFVSFHSEQLGGSLSPLAIFRDVNKFTGEVAASSNNMDEVKRLMYAGYGIGFLPDNAVEAEIRKGIFRRLYFEDLDLDIPIYLVWGKQRHLKPAEQVFVQGLMRAFNGGNNGFVRELHTA